MPKSPQDFLEQVVWPNIQEFKADVASERLAYNAICSVDALTAHLYEWGKQKNCPTALSASNDSIYRALLASKNQRFELVRDIAKAQKHVKLTKHNPLIAAAEKVSAREIGWGEGPFDGGRYGGVGQVIVNLTDDQFDYVENILDDALAFLVDELRSMN